MSGVTCSTCGAPVERTVSGQVEQIMEYNASPPGRFVQHRYGTANHPCGCIDGGLRFDFTAGES